MSQETPVTDQSAMLAAILAKLTEAVTQRDESAPALIQQILADNRAAMEALEQRRKEEDALINARSNIAHPDISAFNPLGERDHPRPQFRARKVEQCGIELSRDQLRKDEIELINKLVEHPGERFVTKADSTRIRFRVQVDESDSGQLEKLQFWYPCKNEHRNNHAPLTNYIQEYLGEPDERTRLLQEIASLKEKLTAQGQPVGA